jgi:hypothetical protein
MKPQPTKPIPITMDPQNILLFNNESSLPKNQAFGLLQIALQKADDFILSQSWKCIN